MGLGFDPCGFAPCGVDSVQPPSPRQTLPPQGAPIFQLSRRQFVQQADGTFVTGDEVDQAVALALGIASQTIGSAPTIGSTVKALGRLAPATRAAAIQDAVQVALQALLDASLITVVGIDIDVSTRGQTLLAVSYWNLRRNSTVPTTLRSVL